MLNNLLFPHLSAFRQLQTPCSQIGNHFPHTVRQLFRALFHVRQISDHQPSAGKNIASLPPFAADPEAVLIFPDEISVPALPVHLLDAAGFLYIFFRQDPCPLIQALVHQHKSDAAQLIYRQLHSGSPVKIPVGASLEGRVFKCIFIHETTEFALD